MKKILKTASLFIIAIVFTFGFNLNVLAEDECGDLSSNECRVTESGFVIQPAGNAYYNYRYKGSLYAGTMTSKTVYNPGNNRYRDIGIEAHFNATGNYYYGAYYDAHSSLYCLDAQYNGGSKLYAERFLLDTNESKKVQAHDYAIMYILTGGGNSLLSSPSSNMKEYWARLTAMRAINQTFGFFSGAVSDIEYYGAFYAGINALVSWNKENVSYYNNLNDALKRVNAGSLKSMSEFSSYNYKNYYYTGDVLNTAKNYYFNALKETTEFVNSMSSLPKVEQTGIEIVQKELPEFTVGNKVYVQKDIIHTLKVTGIDKNGSFIISSENNGITFKEGAKYDGITEYKITNLEIGTTIIPEEENIPLGSNLAQYLNDEGETIVKVTVHIEGLKSSSNNNDVILKCGQQPIEYSINGTYKSSAAGKYDNYVGTIWYSGESNTQRYISVEKGKNTSENKWNGSTKIQLIEGCTCESLKEACETSQWIESPACKELESANCECEYLEIACAWNTSKCDNDKLVEVCNATCDTYVDTFECCDEQGDLIVSTIDDKEVSILGPGPDNEDSNNIKACFVDKIDKQKKNEEDGYSEITGVNDQKGNSYTLGAMSENKYCSVSCKEDYVMTMPTAKLVNAGRYFTFKAKVEGTKVCYTNTIDRDQYNKDIEQAQKDLVDAYNEYEFWRQAAAIESDHDTSYDNNGGPCTRCCGGRAGCSTCTPPRDPVPCTDRNCSYKERYGDVVTKEWTFEMFDYNGNSSGVVNYYVAPNGKIYSGNYKDGQEAYCPSCSCSCGSCRGSIGHDPDDDHIHNATEAKKKLESAQKAYAKIIEDYNYCSGWDSEINYDADVYYDYEENYINQFNHMGEMVESTSKTINDDWYCNGTTSGMYGYTYGDLNNNYDNCKGNNNYSYTLINYLYCDNVGCSYSKKESAQKISNASYKKVTSSITANYKPATLFYNVYPSGEITVNSSDNNVALENSLPVALNTNRGIYKYTVNIENLGEFYNSTSKNNLGRYVGSSTAVVDPDKLVYACSYLVNMAITDEDRLICDFSDTCTDNCISNCIGPNCDNYCNGVDCVADCIGLGCIYDEDAGTSVVEKTVSLNNLFPNGTDSYNWNKDKNDKAKSTISEIESAGNSVYDGTPILSITIDPSTAREIKKYNDRVENDGGYSNATISCEDIGNSRELACYSSFISDLLDGDYGNNVVNENSLIADERYRDDVNRYFTKWDGRVSEDDMIGPSWKMGEVK